jgi:hypothetical protein
VFSLPHISPKHPVERKYPSGAPETQPKTTTQSRALNQRRRRDTQPETGCHGSDHHPSTAAIQRATEEEKTEDYSKWSSLRVSSFGQPHLDAGGR